MSEDTNILMSLSITREEMEKARSMDRFKGVENLIEFRLRIDGVQKDMTFEEFKKRILAD